MSTPKERPILMSAPMVRAILRDVDPKTQTRRVVKDPLDKAGGQYCIEHADDNPNMLVHVHNPRCEGYCDYACSYPCPYGQVGDRLWVRETWAFADPDGEDALPEDVYGPRAPFTGCQGPRQIYWRTIYRATNPERHPKYGKALWSPSIHMPRWASRITLEITGVRVERLLDISEEDAIAEGITAHDADGNIQFYPDYFESSNTHGLTSARESYQTLWYALHGPAGPKGWDANPWVWVIEFKRIIDNRARQLAGLEAV